MYGSEIWGFHKANDVEKVHVRFLKQILGVRLQTSNITVYGELGRFPLVILRKINILKYWYKILASQDSLLYKGYVQQVNDITRGSFENNWAFQIKSLLDEVGFTYIWNEQSIINYNLKWLHSVYMTNIFRTGTDL